MITSWKQVKFPVIEALLGTLAVLLIVFVLAFVWHAKHRTTSVLNQANQSANQTLPATPKANISLALSKLPAGWTLVSKTSGAVQVQNAATSCSTAVMYSSDATGANAPSINHLQVALKLEQSKGYKTTFLADDDQILQTSKGSKSINTTMYRVTKAATTSYQDYGFVTSSHYYVATTLACPLQTNLVSAHQALNAITIHQKL